MDNEDRRQYLEEQRRKAECGHAHTIKAGKTMCRDGIYQREKCKDCGTIIKGEKI